MPKLPVLDRIARATNVSINWLVTGEGAMRGPEGPREVVLQPIASREAAQVLRGQATQYRAIPILQARAAAGQPADITPEILEGDVAVIFRQWGDETSFCFRIRGDSMEPKFHDGDIIGVQRWRRSPVELVNKYVALWLEEPPEHRGLTVKLLQRFPDGTYIGTPLNPARHNPPVPLGKAFDGVQLFKVAWWWGRQE